MSETTLVEPGEALGRAAAELDTRLEDVTHAMALPEVRVEGRRGVGIKGRRGVTIKRRRGVTVEVGKAACDAVPETPHRL